MSRTDGHSKSCRAGNCSGCGKGVWRRLDNVIRRRRDREAIQSEIESETDPQEAGVSLMDEFSETFKQAWHEADEAGDYGNRVITGLLAVLPEMRAMIAEEIREEARENHTHKAQDSWVAGMLYAAAWTERHWKFEDSELLCPRSTARSVEGS